MVAAALSIHVVTDYLHRIGKIPEPGSVVILLLFIPLVYAGTSFGLAGTITVVSEGTVLTLINELFGQHTTSELWGEWSVLALIVISGIFLGYRYEKERSLASRLIDYERNQTTRYYESHPLFGEHLLNRLPDGVTLVDDQEIFRYVNNPLEILSGYSTNELLGSKVDKLFPPDRQNDFSDSRQFHSEHPISSIANTGSRSSIRRKDGSGLPVNLSIIPYGLENQPWTILILRDDTMRRTEEEQRFHLAFENNVAGMVITDTEDRVLSVNDSFCKMLGMNREEFLGKTSTAITFDEDMEITKTMNAKLMAGEAAQLVYNKRYVHQNGNIVWAEVSRSLARDDTGKPQYVVVSTRDITEECKLLSQLSHQALHDPLTGLANRTLFEHNLSIAFIKAGRNQTWTGVIFIDLDDFKEVNDSFGHQVGDRLLVEVAQRLEGVTRASDTLCRLGGDEFIYLAEGLDNPSEAESLARRLVAVFDQPFPVKPGGIIQTATIGVATSFGEDSDVDLLRDADTALYHAKLGGKNRSASFKPEMHQQVSHRVELVRDLRLALELNELSMYYQPIVDLRTNQIVGAEALMRWNHPKHGWVSPDEFISLSERSNLIFELGTFALEHAIPQAAAWNPVGPSEQKLWLSINLSPRQFHDPNLLDCIENVLETADFEPERLIFEITEGAAMVDINSTIQVVADLRSIGVKLAIDDFGAGYSSLVYFNLLHPSILKIDREFVVQANETPNGERLLMAMLTIGRSLDVTVVAEGIETTDQRELLQGLGYTYGQGYLLSVPLPPADFSRLLIPKT